MPAIVIALVVIGLGIGAIMVMTALITVVAPYLAAALVLWWILRSLIQKPPISPPIKKNPPE